MELNLCPDDTQLYTTFSYDVGSVLTSVISRIESSTRDREDQGEATATRDMYRQL